MRTPSLPTNTPWFGRFDLDIGQAIADQLSGFLEHLNPEPLSNSGALGTLPRTGGVYTLHHGGNPVYVGKAANLRTRLGQHASDLDGRRNIARGDVAFACAELSRNWAPFGAEDILMARARLAWQHSGFGNNDPGRNRDSSVIGPKHWDAQFPIRFDWRCDNVRAGPHNAAELLDLLKRTLPFVLRFQRAVERSSHAPPPADVQAATVRIPESAMPFWDIMGLIVAALPGWQATALPGYAIFYRESVDYPSALAIHR
jgi:hypothetical protein